MATSHLIAGTKGSSMWRSENMVLLEMTMQREAAHQTVERLGELGYVEFKDLSSHLNAFQRQFANEVKRCEELDRIIRFFEDQIEKSEVKFSEGADFNDEETNEYGNVLDSFERDFSQHEKELRDLSGNLDQMVAEKNKAEEYSYVLNLAAQFFKGDEESYSGDSESGLMVSRGSSLGYLTGVIPREKISTFLMLIYRSTRGNVVPRMVEIPTPLFDAKSGKSIEKSVFTVFFGASSAKEKVKKVCEALGASIHDFPEDDVAGAQRSVQQKINELDTTIESSKLRVVDILSKISVNLPRWKERVHKEKAIFHTLNLFNYDIKGSVVAVGWAAEKNFENVKREMEEARLASNAQVPSICDIVQPTETPPTYFETNKFTDVFQQIVNSYGIPDYKEMNPAVAAVILFPFLFAVMFGDFGHGILLAAAAIAMVVFEKKLKPIAENSELLAMVFQGRYILVLMGLFSIYTGFLYNDGLGLAVDIFPSAYEFNSEHVGEKIGRTYPFGVDPAWFHTSNKLLFYNSIKMKMSVIFGVGHMSIGLFFALANMIQFGHFLDIFVEFIPEVLILWCTFGYMCVLIVYKWCVNWGDEVHSGKFDPPQILPMMTDYFLSPWKMSQPPMFYYGGDVAEAQARQSYAQMALLLITAISVPILLIPKPIAEYLKQKRKFKHRKVDDAEVVNSNSDESHHVAILDGTDGHDNVAHTHGEGHAEMEPFSELFIKQLIHTIEYVLGTVSNTASYLRLWALSLAHAQLAEVFWQMTIGLILNQLESMPEVETAVVHSGVGVFFVFALWFGMTIGVLLVMESLSAFLHALRLTWVEFQNKFFKGTGSLFRPFSFETFGKNDD
ncbi:vacuolar proton translocating ATPase [Naegleria gruberi]|uniref:V-type proton ATPase subunit a n=1 Tax=Naegleria gruberi TaxID=5762 RepID=D2VRP1_NAEGR|nr:vacuolar proton translocating ATPase [Naegleria gruberi]EFC40495.1 vacuolar proton translocating ATPase [Naegleria gruberi]|eukprot:XP_002673239.1 vacuolar proton translocating ATPase [Naegleria gruberi strain NEG-M]